MSPAKTRGGTHARLIEAAIDLLRQSGLAGAGINDIVRESGAPKGSVYHFFPGGKRQIAEEALDIYAQRVERFIDAAMARKHGPGDKVRALFDAFAERVEASDFRRSCPAGTVGLDLEPDLDALRIAVGDSLRRYAAAIGAQLPMRGRKRTESFAGLLLSAIEGAYIRCRAERSGEPFREAGRWLAVLAEHESRR